MEGGGKEGRNDVLDELGFGCADAS